MRQSGTLSLSAESATSWSYCYGKEPVLALTRPRTLTVGSVERSELIVRVLGVEKIPNEEDKE
jgi:hypothetical protein